MDTTDSLNCNQCKKTFSQKSSLVRHLKLCSRPKIANRKKSCSQCSYAKVKCDVRKPSCSKCSLRGFECSYLTAIAEATAANGSPPSQQQSLSSSSATTLEDSTPAAEPLEDFLNRVNKCLEPEPHSSSITPTDHLLSIDSSHLPIIHHGSTDLVLNGHFYQNSLRSSEIISDFPPTLLRHSMRVMLRVSRTWPSMMAKGLQTPPIFHHTSDCSNRSIPLPIANCSTLVMMWYGQHEKSSDIVHGAIIMEMKNIFEHFRSYDEQDLLGALQAVILYVIMLMFPNKTQVAIPTIDPSIFSGIQQLIYHTGNTGLILQEETENMIPTWEAWIHITAKRRAIFSVYLLHWSYSCYHGLSSFNCAELGFMPAPPAKYLWQAQNAEQWEFLYKKWLVEWDGNIFIHNEFMHVKPGVMLDERTNQWLEDADDFGVLFSSMFNTVQHETECMQECDTDAHF